MEGEEKTNDKERNGQAINESQLFCDQHVWPGEKKENFNKNNFSPETLHIDCHGIYSCQI